MNDPHPSDTADLAEIRRAIVSLVEEYAELANAPGLFSPGVTPIPASGKLIGTAGAKHVSTAYKSIDQH